MRNQVHYPQLRAVLLEIEAFLAEWQRDEQHTRLLQRAMAKLRKDFLDDKIFPAMAVPTMAWQALGRHDDQALYVLNAAHYLFYCFLDLTDDVEDQELQDTLWDAVGAPLAINAGTSLMFASQLMLERLTAKGVKKARVEALKTLFMQAGWLLTIGQHRDLASSRSQDLTPEDVLRTHALKTGTSVGLYLESAALLAGAKPAQQRHFAALGQALGVMVQIIGDWRNLQQPISSDLKNKCQSLPLVILQTSLRIEDRDVYLAALAGATKASPDLAAHDIVRHLLHKNSVPKVLNQHLSFYRNKALEALEHLRRSGCSTGPLGNFVARFEPL